MRNILFFKLFLLFLSTCAFASENDYTYEVQFEGIEDKAIECLLNSSSQLVSLQKIIPPTAAALRRRADEDIPNLLKALQSRAYYHPKILAEIDDKQHPILITLHITPGPVYPFASFKIISVSQDDSDSYPFETISPEDLGIEIGDPALPATIIEAEDILIDRLENEGYPLVKLIKREVIADQAEKSISVILHVDSGPITSFGPVDVIGNCNVLPSFFTKKIRWCTGQRYDPEQVNRTINALEASGLFSSINITHDETVQPDGTLPMHITVQEAKHRSIGFGLGYATDLGFGVNGEWEHRNMRGMGEKLSFVTNIWQIKQEGYIRYVKPDFCLSRQDLIWQATLNSQETKGFDEKSASFSGTIERQLTDRLRIAYGGMFTLLRNTHSDNNGSFNIFKIPLQLMWNQTNSLLDPTSGYTMHLRTTPALQTLGRNFAYTTHLVSATAYKALDEDQRFVLAGKATIGSIWGANKHAIPPSERFYAGSDTLLRGYRYLTVSPLGRDHKPIGGRSLMVYSMEARMRLTNTWGLVAFYDIGNVYSESLPMLSHKQLQSAGIGIRYHTPVGPIRLDIAFPFNPRSHLDNAFQIYFSIGQSF